MNLKRRAAGGFALLCSLFLALVFLQLVVSDRTRDERAARIERMDRTREVNHAVLQYMTDAESGVRGFQLTGERIFLDPYESGKRQAFTAFDQLVGDADDAELRRLVAAEREAAAHWFYGYAIPIVNAGVEDADDARVSRGRTLFDEVRQTNAAVDAAVAAVSRRLAEADRRAATRAELLFSLLSMVVLITGMAIALVHQRQVLEPVEHIRHTLRRLADGDLSARAVPAGPGELRAVIGTLNDVAGEIERLIRAEQAEAARGELRRRVAAELRTDRDLAESARRIGELIGRGLSADAVHGTITVGRGVEAALTWPPGTAELDPQLVRQLTDGEPGEVREIPGGLALTLGGDEDCHPGLVFVVRSADAEWQDDERRLLARLGREIDDDVRRLRLGLRQERLISELRLLDAQKDVFVATVTHELRTPLTSLLGYTEMLTEDGGGDLNPIQRRSLTAIQRNAHRLRDTVADLLLLDEANEHLMPAPGPVDLAALLTGLHGELATAARAKDMESVLDIEPAWVRGDYGQLGCALRKLAENAIKFTPPGGRIELRLTTDGVQAVLTVSDTGMGIPPEDLLGLFTPFHRAANAMDEAVQGPGLGLAIVRNIITDHGGTVSARSELGQGSTFTVTLPAIRGDAVASSPPPVAAASTPGRG